MPSPDIETGQLALILQPPPERSLAQPILFKALSFQSASQREAVFPQRRDGMQLPLPPKVDESYKELDDREGAFSIDQRFQVRNDQKFSCAACGKACRGTHFDEPILTVHHILPLKQGGNDNLINAVGLCPEDHKVFDALALEYNLFPIPVSLDMRKSPPQIQEIFSPRFSQHRELPQLSLGHKRLQKGRKIKTPAEIKKHQERLRKNPQPRPVVPPSIDVFTYGTVGAD